jgi:hypothetical protein
VVGRILLLPEEAARRELHRLGATHVLVVFGGKVGYVLPLPFIFVGRARAVWVDNVQYSSLHSFGRWYCIGR